MIELVTKMEFVPVCGEVLCSRTKDSCLNAVLFMSLKHLTIKQGGLTGAQQVN